MRAARSCFSFMETRLRLVREGLEGLRLLMVGTRMPQSRVQMKEIGVVSVGVASRKEHDLIWYKE